MQCSNYNNLLNWDTVETKTSGTIASETRTDTSFNEYATIGGTAQTHDDNGNLTSDSLRVFAWDGFNRLREVRTTTDSLIASYCYDAGNRRMQKDVGHSAPAGQDTDFFYSAWQLLEERNLDTSGTLRYSFVWGNYIDELLARDDGAAGRLFYHQNTLFSTYAVSDEAGDIQERYAYDPYGKVTFFDDTGTVLTASTLSVHHLFTGRETDPETGLQLNRHRYYDAERGRWIKPDPAREDLPALFSYVLNSPTKNVDPHGLESEQATNGCTCGPEVSTILTNTLMKMTKVYESWGIFEKLDHCTRMNSLGGWDMEGLIKASKGLYLNCATGPCKNTIMVNGECHGVWQVNYITWGHMNKLCGRDWNRSIWDLHVLPDVYSLTLSYALLKPFDHPFEKLEWTKLGYDGWPYSGTPTTPKRFQKCKQCPENPYPRILSFAVTWKSVSHRDGIPGQFLQE